MRAIRRRRFDGGDYERTALTETAYLYAHGERLGRLYYGRNDVPTLTSGNLHLLLELQDHLGSSALVVDFATSELVEASTYQAYGAAESDYRPARWDAYRDDFRFTGKEDDVDVGLTYFGKRFLSARLGRWLSADPLSIHGLSADANAYAYVRGRVLSSRDLVGLEDTNWLHVGLGVVYGTIQAVIPPLHLVPDPKGATGDFKVGQGAGQVVTGIVQGVVGIAMVAGGGAATGGGGASVPVTGPVGAGIAAGGAAVAVAGLAIGATGAFNAAKGVVNLHEGVRRKQAAAASAGTAGPSRGVNQPASPTGNATKPKRVEQAPAPAAPRKPAPSGEHVPDAALGGQGPAAEVPRGGTYKLRDPETQQVRRTGRTNDLARRESEHGRHPETRDLDFEVDRRTDSYAAQRGREERIWEQHPEADLNRKRPISAQNARRDEYLREGDKVK